MTILLGVALAAVAATLLRAFWYSQLLFRTTWSKLSPYADDFGDHLQHTPNRVQLATVVSYLAMALMFSFIARGLHIETAAAGARLGGLLWLGFVLPSTLIASMYSERSVTAFVLDVLFQLIYFVIMGLIIGAMP
jgi:hypothetical protein